jgi:hypothetical protein
VDGEAASRALEVAHAILAKIKEHGDLVASSVEAFYRQRGSLPV